MSLSPPPKKNIALSRPVILLNSINAMIFGEEEKYEYIYIYIYIYIYMERGRVGERERGTH